MTRPKLVVEVGFTAALTGTALHLDDQMRGRLDSATLAAGDLFADLSDRVVSVSTRRGASRADGPVLRYEAGSATIVFRNDDRALDPTNLEGPYVAGGVTQVEPMRAVRIRASYNGQTWPLWRGFTNEWTVAYDGPNSSYATVTCFDAFEVFAAYNRLAVAAIGAGEDTGARIKRILDSISWPTTDRMIATGEETVQATTLADNVLSELLLTADTELGEFWIDADGRARFRARSASYTSSRSAFPLAAFGDAPDYTEATTINLATNPSAETGLANWTGGGFANPPTLTRSTARAVFGTSSVLATWATATPGDLPLIQYAVTGLTPGRTYTFSVYAYVPTGSPSVALVIASTGPWGTSTGDAKDQWVRLTLTTTVNTASPQLQAWPYNSTAAAGQQVFLDGLQIEEGQVATAYVDGSQPDAEWDGIPHESTSRRLTELDYGDLTLAYDALSITNQVTAAPVGGTEQTAIDSASVSAYLVRSHERTDLLMQTDPEARLWAEQVLARRSMPELRVAGVLLKPARDPDRLWPQAFGREIGDRVRVVRRPPGGGQPIIRDAWVRGIEHDLGKDLAWRTTLTLEQARNTISVMDTFTRTVSNGWGSADTGQAWTTSGGVASDYSVSSGLGRHSVNATNSTRSTLLGLDLPNLDAVWSVQTPVVAAGAQIVGEFLARYIDANNHYRFEVGFQTGGTVDIRIRQILSGASSVLTSQASALATYAVNTPVWVRCQAVGTTLRMKVWANGAAEPSTWTVTTVNSSHAHGLAGFLSLLAGGNTNTLPVVLAYDNAALTSLNAWA